MKLHHVQLLIPPGGEEVARAFYAGVLGMAEVEKPPELRKRGGCWFRREDLELHLSPVDDFAPATRAHPGVLVDDLDFLARKLETAGRPVRWDTNFPGFRRFHSADDHGNRLEFMQEIRD